MGSETFESKTGLSSEVTPVSSAAGDDALQDLRSDDGLLDEHDGHPQGGARNETEVHGLEPGRPSEDVEVPISYKVYKRRWFGLIQLILLNIVVSWDVRISKPKLSCLSHLTSNVFTVAFVQCCFYICSSILQCLFHCNQLVEHLVPLRLLRHVSPDYLHASSRWPEARNHNCSSVSPDWELDQIRRNKSEQLSSGDGRTDFEWNGPAICAFRAY